jgi:hypothetical protein
LTNAITAIRSEEGSVDFAGTIPLVRAAVLLFSLASMGMKDNA